MDQFLRTSVLCLLGFGVPTGIVALAQDKKDSPLGVGVPQPLKPAAFIDGDTKVDYLVKLKLSNVPADAIVFWDVYPPPKETYESDCDTTFIFTGPPGKYTVKARGINGGKKFSYVRTVEITGGKKDPVDPPVPPEPIPPEPVPPVGKVAYFIVVEDTLKSQSWRGDILGSPVVQAAYKNLQGTKTTPVHRLISVHSTSETPEVKKYIALAQGKELPWIWLLNENRQPIDPAGQKVPVTSPDEFAKLITPVDPQPKAMGNKPPPEGKLKYQWSRFGATPNVPIIPRDRWKEVNLSAYLPAVKDQDGQGACNAFATITATESCRKQAGLKYARLSCGFLYGNINDGVDAGSFLEDGLAFMVSDGTCLTTTIGDLDWRNGRRRPQAAVDEAKNYRVLEAYLCPDFDSMASALQQGFFIVEGLMWYDNFNPDRDGWLPSVGGGGVGGHALCGYGLAERNGKWGIRTRNSWGTAWGVGGDCIIPEPLFGRQVGGFWAVRAVVQTPTDFSTRKDLRYAFEESPLVTLKP